MFEQLTWSLRTRGLTKTVVRSAHVLERYGISNRYMASRLRDFVAVLEKHGVRATFPVTVASLANNIDLISELKDSRLEVAFHGYLHEDLTQLSESDMRYDLTQGTRFLRRHFDHVVGIRCPYLRASDKILLAAQSLGYRYDSSTVSYFDVLGQSQTGAIADLLAMYKGTFTHPWRSNRCSLIEIPVTLPDDEILVDRMGLSADMVAKVWRKILGAIGEREKGIFVLQLHLERFDLLRGALLDILARARSTGVQITTLQEFADRSKEESGTYLAITSDIDVFRIWDLLMRRN